MKTNALRKVFALMLCVVTLCAVFIITPAADVDSTVDPTGWSTKYANGNGQDSWTAAQVNTSIEAALADRQLSKTYSTVQCDEYPYSLSLTLRDDSSSKMPVITETVYLAEKPGSNAIEVSIGRNGRVYVDGVPSDTKVAWKSVYSVLQTIITGLSGIGTLVLMILLIVNIMKFATSVGNPTQRSQAISSIIWLGIACAALSAVAIIFGFFYNAI